MTKCIKSLIVPENLALVARSALIHYLEVRRENCVDFVKRCNYQAAFEELNVCAALDAYLNEIEKNFQFDEDEEAPF